jgi:phage gpG-like protein
MSTIQNQHASITIRAERFTDELKKKLERRIKLAAEKVKTQVQKNISQPTRAIGPSKPGDFPHADTGRLRNTIFWRMDGELRAIVGTNLIYGLWLEYGTQGGKTIYAAPGKAFSWIDPNTGDRAFSKKITLGAITGRSFLRRTLFEMASTVRGIILHGGVEAEVEVIGSA